MTCIYIFGSLVRGEVDQYSDTDLLLISDNKLFKDVDSDKFSLYTPDRIKELYNEGNPFAWHLYFESKLVYSSSEYDFLSQIGKPSEYKNCKNDLLKFKNLFDESIISIKENNYSLVFDLAMIFLAIRNFATCYTLGCYQRPIFSRLAFEKLDDNYLILDDRIKELLMMSRISSTRGIDYIIKEEYLSLFKLDIERINEWFNKIMRKYESGI
ncbi:nucleotidyltransferase domain-containing protein [Chryseobacterium sp. JJR-5R]|uniref:nucleotidyltransferase domain-containing protein n=1 Tax=Chryseobacterium sp. JJR-5R TaxID=3093923 RepID=UPI002A7630E7|nr:nucleotidyltransferase domain-containing protein [Chryseobacterium sp. JJR-5R]WPO84025.1 nucleotidyltransferase domain-containing protein [Chryseobacterium sp. JJR-5R]